MNIIIYEDKSRNEGWYDYDLSNLLLWAKAELLKLIDELKNDIYNERINKELPYELRYGTIGRMVYWQHRPNEKKERLQDLSNSDINRLINILKTDNDIPAERIKDMTFKQYFDYAVEAFKAVGYDVNGLSSYKAFRKYGEDFGGGVLENIDHNSPDDFYRYYKGEWRMGGHPWGLLRGSSRTRIFLCPVFDENGCYFIFLGNPNWMSYEMAKMYLTLKDSGLPMQFENADEIISYLSEEDLIGIVTANDMICYCQSDFPGQTVNDFRHFHSCEDADIKDLISWLPPTQIRLKNNK